MYGQNMMFIRFALILGSLSLSVIPIAALADTFNGTSGDDNVRGTNGDDEIFTGEGSDRVKARGGDDHIEDIDSSSDQPSNLLKGGKGDDEIIWLSDEGSYTAFGNRGNDKIDIGTIQIIAYGGSGNDVLELRGDCGLEAYGQSGDDQIFASENNCGTTVDGGSGDDSLDVSISSGNVYGGKGDDEIRLNANIATAHGNSDDDTLISRGGVIEIFGGEGDDVFISELESSTNTFTGKDGADNLECGPGQDTVSDYEPDQGDVVSDDCEVVNG